MFVYPMFVYLQYGIATRSQKKSAPAAPPHTPNPVPEKYTNFEVYKLGEISKNGGGTLNHVMIWTTLTT